MCCDAAVSQQLAVEALLPLKHLIRILISAVPKVGSRPLQTDCHVPVARAEMRSEGRATQRNGKSPPDTRIPGPDRSNTRCRRCTATPCVGREGRCQVGTPSATAPRMAQRDAQGVRWSDTAAATGQQAPSTQASLSSPPYSCSGATGLLQKSSKAIGSGR